MSPLSAISAFAAPELAPLPLARPGAQPVAPNPIPFSELKELGASGLSQTVPPTEPGASFGSVLGNLVNEVNDKQTAAGEAVKNFITRPGGSLPPGVLAAGEATRSVQILVGRRQHTPVPYHGT